METSKPVSISCVGNKTGKPYNGSFTIMTVTTNRIDFQADLRRRQILGPSPDGTPPAANLQWKAFMLGQLFARIQTSPSWWESSDYGLDLEDDNVVTEVYNKLLEAEEEAEKAIKDDAKKALKKLANKPEEEVREEFSED